MLVYRLDYFLYRLLLSWLMMFACISLAFSFQGDNLYWAIEGNRDTARYRLLKAKETGDCESVIAALNNLGHLEFNASHYSEALQLFLEALRRSRQIADLPQIANSFSNIASVYARNGEFEKALLHYRMALQGYEELGLSLQSMVCKLSIGLVYISFRRFDEALPILEETAHYFENHQNYWPIDAIYQNLALCYEGIGQITVADAYYDEGIRQAIEFQDQHSLSNLLINKGILTARIDEQERALQLIQRGLAIAKKLRHHYELERLAYTHLWKINKKLNRLDEAIVYLEELLALNDIIYNETTARQISNLMVRYETAQKADSIHLLQAKHLIHQTAIRQQRLINQMMIGSLVLLSIVLGLLYRLYYLKQKQHTKVEQMNHFLKEKTQKIELLHRELSHRIKNNLAFISSLTRMQSRRLDNEEAREALRESENRLQAMSILHQRLFLYRKDTHINLAEYLKELIKNLQLTYGSDRYPSRIYTDLDDIELEADPAVRIGLIVNELFINAVKHAFVEQSRPEILIKLKKKDTGGFKLSVRDNGKGLSEAIRSPKGNALGLEIIQTLVRQLNGQIHFESERGTFVEIDFFHLKYSIDL